MSVRPALPLALIAVFAVALAVIALRSNPAPAKSTAPAPDFAPAPIAAHAAVEAVERTAVARREFSVRAVTKAGPLAEVRVFVSAAGSSQAPTPAGITAGTGQADFDRSLLTAANGLVLCHPGYATTFVPKTAWTDQSSVTVSMRESARLSVVARDTLGRPVEGVTCVAANAQIGAGDVADCMMRTTESDPPAWTCIGTRTVATAKTDRNGAATIDDLAAGRFSLQAHLANHIVSELTVAGDQLPSSASLVFMRPWVALATLPPEIEWWYADIPKGMGPVGAEQAAVARLQAELRSRFPRALVVVCAEPDEELQSLPALDVDILHHGNGWMHATFALRPYLETMTPETFVVPEAPPAAMGEFLLTVTEPDGSPWPYAENTPWLIAPKGARGRVGQSRTIELANGKALRLPVGDYDVLSYNPLVRSLCGAVALSIAADAPAQVAIHLPKALAQVTLRATDDAGDPIRYGSATVRSAGLGAYTYLFNDALDGSSIWIPGDTAEVLIEADGYPEVSKAIALSRSAPTELLVTCRRQ